MPSATVNPRTALFGPSPFAVTVLEPDPELSVLVLTFSVPVPFRWSVPLPRLRNALASPVRVMAPDTVTSASLSNTTERPASESNWNPGIVTSGPV